MTGQDTGDRGLTARSAKESFCEDEITADGQQQVMTQKVVSFTHFKESVSQ